MYAHQIVIKMSRCRPWSQRFELTCFRKLPCVLNTVAGVSSREGSEGSSDKDLDPQVLPVPEQFGARDSCGWHLGGMLIPLCLHWPGGDFHASHQEGDIMVKHLTLLSIPFAWASLWKEDKCHI